MRHRSLRNQQPFHSPPQKGLHRSLLFPCLLHHRCGCGLQLRQLSRRLSAGSQLPYPCRKRSLLLQSSDHPPAWTGQSWYLRYSLQHLRCHGLNRPRIRRKRRFLRYCRGSCIPARGSGKGFPPLCPRNQPVRLPRSGILQKRYRPSLSSCLP